FPIISNVRGLGLLLAFDFPSFELRKRVRLRCWHEGLAALPCGPISLRFRPPLIFSENEVAKSLDILRGVLADLPEVQAEIEEAGPGRETPG
ncbi:MAG: aminotransferase class III-fold pyridoxal phosphate-dependent enzyme, partial [Acidobacteriota bacterium]